MGIARIRQIWLSFFMTLGVSGGLVVPVFVVPVFMVSVFTAHGQENPMRGQFLPIEDDEPEAAQAEPVAPPVATSAERLKMVTAPLPPVRPWARPAAKPDEKPGAPAPDAKAAAEPEPNEPEAKAKAASPAVVVDAPLPPIRPNGLSPVGRAATLAVPVTPAEPEAGSPSAAPSRLPTIAGPERDFQLSIEPDMRVAFASSIAIPSTTEEIEAEEERTPEPTFVEKQTDAVDIACIKPEVMGLIRTAGEHFGGTPVITSGQRDRGRRGSFHRKCMAADFFVPGIERSRLAKYLRGMDGAGGVGTYCHTKSVHIDIGEPRNWSQCGRRFRFAQR